MRVSVVVGQLLGGLRSSCMALWCRQIPPVQHACSFTANVCSTSISTTMHAVEMGAIMHARA